ncbi:hypothetical protein C1702_03345 [Caldimonas thermodepolymerans]|uniref:Outer membrane protein OmpA-like peptidoglycan-associated protein n=2 Tax=Caldimonas thermodepolymerans TaxID=215580 RepID=A0A2S5T7W4_9BURK|nr:hypothetical protein C1702_03345 [Caldimonas thermodepolymerans]RDH99723.1 outer membrane protein OmpA-like peptidoglycan-associated protein [Caldimonas thermodepolymerans]TCP07551.1 outer membrane protein OmpA-like peptidoglycan-associated protein [Caldimonas thermodepolymerans]
MRMALSRAAWLLAGSVLLAGCGSTGGSLFPGLGGASLDAQRHRLARELAGTPVVVAAVDDGYRVAVPLKYAFDPRRSAVKPPLAAVLDRVAQGVKDEPGAQVRVTAPGDGRSSPMLARDRAESTRDYLIARGVPRERFAGVEAGADGTDVEITVSARRATAAR